MRTRAICRAGAVLIAIAGAIDPALTRMRPSPAVVALLSGSDTADVAAIRSELQALVGDQITIAAGDTLSAHAYVLAADAVPADLQIPETATLAAVTSASSRSPSVRVARLEAPDTVRLSARSPVRVEVTGIGLAGHHTNLVLESDGIQIARARHDWQRGDDVFAATLEFLPVRAGVAHLTVTAETGGLDAARADAVVTVTDRPYDVLVYEPRVSWNGTFIRRALESDPRFAVTAIGRASRGVVVRSSGAPASLAAANVGRFDAVVIAAPDALSESEVRLLEAYARSRAGGVALAPDASSPRGYLRLIPLQLDEWLLDRPADVAHADRPATAALRASEALVAESLPPGAAAIASLTRGAITRPTIVGSPLGPGRVVFAGALDAWRFRGAAPFEDFWRTIVAALADQSPPPLRVAVAPRALRPGDALIVTARVRASRLDRSHAPPPITARLQDGTAGPTTFRLWPAAEPGVFVGRARAPEREGPHIVAVELDDEANTTATAPILVGSTLRPPSPLDVEGLELLTASRGGIVVPRDRIDTLAAHLRSSLAGDPTPVVWRPARSAWTMLPFALLLSVEWLLRRRAGLR
jgi:hypothetical protein